MIDSALARLTGIEEDQQMRLLARLGAEVATQMAASDPPAGGVVSLTYLVKCNELLHHYLELLRAVESATNRVAPDVCLRSLFHDAQRSGLAAIVHRALDQYESDRDASRHARNGVGAPAPSVLVKVFLLYIAVTLTVIGRSAYQPRQPRSDAHHMLRAVLDLVQSTLDHVAKLTNLPIDDVLEHWIGDVRTRERNMGYSEITTSALRHAQTHLNLSPGDWKRLGIEGLIATSSG